MVTFSEKSNCYCVNDNFLVTLSTYQPIAGTYRRAPLHSGLSPHFTQEMALGGANRFDLRPLQATKSPLCQEARSQQVTIKSEVEVQAVVAVPKLVEYTI